AEELLAEALVQIAPGAHVRRFFLNPERRNVVGVALQRIFHQIGTQRIKLFQPNDSDVGASVLFAVGSQLVVYFSAANEQALRLAWFDDVRQRALEMSSSTIFQR